MWTWGKSNLWNVGQAFGKGVSALMFAALLCMPSAADATAKRPHLTPVKETAAPEGFAGVCARYTWACARAGGSKHGSRELMRMADEVNQAINRSTREVSDEAQYARSEYWALPTARGGDCEDFALAKKQALIGRGVAPQNLLIATVLDRKRNPHAVLVMRTESGDFVLDNLTDRILDWRATGYTFLRMQNPSSPGHWSAILTGGILGG
jgi:predicted transglutaminase-like cysteine proteinase